MTINRQVLFVGIASIMASVSSIRADILADWTFETSQPAAAGTFSPEIGSGSIWAVLVSSSATYTSPDGNGSAHSFNANHWGVGDYFEFSVSASGHDNLTVSYDQVSSTTGPGLYNFAYSTDNINFTDFASSYMVRSNASPNPVWNMTTGHSIYTYTYNLGSVLVLNNAPNVYFRVIDASTTSAGGGTVGLTGADRLDNIIVTGTAVPEPGNSLWLESGGAVVVAFLISRLRRAAIPPARQR